MDQPQSELATAVVKAAMQMVEDKVSDAVSWSRGKADAVRQRILSATGKAFEQYYTRTAERFASTKTILYRTDRVPLYEFFVPMSVRRGDDVLSTRHASSLTTATPYSVITGLAGSGKSTLLKHLFLDAIQSRQHLPILIELRRLAETDPPDLRSLLYREVVGDEQSVSQAIFELQVSRGRFLILLDAFDEVPSAHARTIERQVLELADRFPECPVIMTSRPDERFVSWNAFSELALLPLDRDQAIELVNRLRYEPEVKGRFVGAMKETLFESHQSFLQNPLLLTLMLMTYDQFGSIPSKMHLFYAQAFDTLFMKHDATKEGYRRELYSRLASDDFQRALGAFALASYLRGKTTFAAPELDDLIAKALRVSGFETKCEVGAFRSDMLVSLCLMFQDGLLYTFAHRSFQEYFAARFLVGLDTAQRTRVLREIKGRMRSDSVVKVAWEMSPEAVEDFLIGEIEALATHYDFDPADPRPAVLAFHREVFPGANLSYRGIDTFPVDDRRGVHQPEFVFAVAEMLDLPFESNPNRKEAVRTLTKRLGTAPPDRKHAKGIVIAFDTAYFVEQRPVDFIPFSKIEADAASIALFYDALGGTRTAFEAVLTSLPALKERRARRASSLDQLLA